MPGMETTQTSQSEPQAEAVQSAPERAAAALPAGRGPGRSLRRLQRQAGNRALGRLVSGGQPLDAQTREYMEERFGYDLSTIQIHTGLTATNASRAANARAFTVGSDLVFGAGQYDPHGARGQHLLAHELAHAIQQSRGGSSQPSPLPDSPLENSARRAAEAAEHARGPVEVEGASAPGMAREPLSLTQSINPSLLSDEELANEIAEIRTWLKNNAGSADADILKDFLVSYQAEMAKRGQSKPAPAKPARPAKGSMAKTARKASPPPESQAAGAGPEPLSLTHSMDPSTMSDAEIEQEVQAIRLWLRNNPQSPDADILQESLARLEQAAAQRPAEKPAPPPRPKLSSNGGQALREAMAIVNSITPSENASGLYTILYEGEEIEITEQQRLEILDKIRSAFKDGIRNARSKAESAETGYDAQKAVDRDYPVTSTLVQFFGGVEDPGLELKSKVSQARIHATVAELALKEGDFATAAQSLEKSEQAAVRAYALYRAFNEGTISAAEGQLKVLEITRDVSLSITIGIGAVVAAPVVAAGAATVATGAGLTGAAATTFTVVGTGATLTAGGAVAGGTLRGGTNVAGQALTGEEINWEEAKQETITGAKRGAVDAATAWATAGTAGALGQSASLTGKVVKGATAGYVGGTTGGALEATLEGKSVEEILVASQKSGLSGAIGGGIGGAGNAALGDRSGAAKFLVETASGATGAGLGAAATGASAEEIKQAAITGGLASGVVSLATPSVPRGGRQQKQAPPPVDETTVAKPTEIVGEPVLLPPGPEGPLYDAKGEPIGVIPKKRSPLVDESGRPLTGKQPKPKPAPALLGPDEQPINQRRRPKTKVQFYGPDNQPLPAKQPKGKKVKAPEPAPKPLLGADGKPLTGETPAATPELLGPDGKPLSGTTRPSGTILDPSGTPIIPGARVQLEEPLLTQAEWEAGITSRGLTGEKGVIQQRYPGSTELPKNFKAFDAVEGGQRTRVFAGQKKGPARPGEIIEGGKAISIKTADLSGKSYQTADGTYSALSKYVDDIINYPKQGYALTGVDPQSGQTRMVRLVNPSERILHVEMSQTPTPAQMDGLARIRDYARRNGIQVIFIAPQ